MQSEIIRSMHHYNKWATDKVLDCAANLTAEQFVMEDELPWGSMRNQLVHALNVHRSWLSWVDGSLPPEEAYRLQDEPGDYPDADSVRAFWSRVWEQTEAYLARVTDEELQQTLSIDRPGVSFQVPVWKVVMHIANHWMQHRTETAMTLTRLGQSPGDLDYIFFAIEEDVSASR